VADEAELVRLSRAHHRQYLALQQSTADLVGAAWQTHRPLDDLSTSRFLGAVESILEGALLETSIAAVAYQTATDLVLGFAADLVASPPQIRGGRSPAEVYKRSVYQARRMIANGASYDDAMRSGLARARQTAVTDVSLANRQAIADTAPQRPWVVGYRRVLTGVSCALCATASTQRYRRADLHPIHPACDCDIAEIVGTSDPGRVINQRLLDDLRTAGKQSGSKKYYDQNAPYIVDADGRVRQRAIELDADGNERVVAGDPVELELVEHGELGRVVTNRSHRTTELADAPERPTAPAISDADAKKAAKAARVAEERRAAKALTVDSPDVIAVADRYGVSPEEVLSSRSRVNDVRAAVREEAALVQRDALATLDRYGSTKVKRPGTSPGGEYDWLKGLDDREKARLSRVWYSDSASDGPDLIAQRIGFADVRFADAQTDDAIEHWLDLTRQAEAAGALRRGRIPSPAAYSDAIDPNAIVPRASAQGYDVNRLFDDPLEAAGHVASVERELLRLDAEQYLGDALTPELGPAPWRMSFQSWEADVRELEFEFANGRGSDADRQRYRELVPEYLDEPGLEFENLYARVIDTAHKAGQEVADYARIPW
jgi:hypothetical protein